MPQDQPLAAGLPAFQERPRKALTGSGFNQLQIDHLEKVVKPAWTKEVLTAVTSLLSQNQRDFINAHGTDIDKLLTPPAGIIPAQAPQDDDIIPTAAIDAIQANAAAAKPNDEQTAPTATIENTPGATASMILLINEQESPEKREGLRQIAMQTDIPHQARLPKMRAYLNQPAPTP